jgi:hypothetical protein
LEKNVAAVAHSIREMGSCEKGGSAAGDENRRDSKFFDDGASVPDTEYKV